MKRFARIASIMVAASLLAGGGVAYQRAQARPEKVASGRGAPTPAPAPATPTPDPAPPSPETPEPPIAPEPEPQPVRGGKLIEVSLERQELIAWDGDKEVFRFTISTGKKGYETPAGRFRIHTKYDNRWSRKWKVWMPYAMFWHPKWGYAFHELPYKPGREHRRIGASKLGTPDSKGCVRVNLGEAKMLYDWAPVGTQVWIH